MIRSTTIAALTTAVALTMAAAAASGVPVDGVDGAPPRAASGAAGSATAVRAAAIAVVKSKGYTPFTPGEYKPWAKLRVLTATATGSASGHNQQAFFFVGRRYIGTATSSPRPSVAYVGQTSTRVRLSYGVFGPGSGDCCPTSHRTVRFQWNGKRLVALDRIP